MRRLDSFNSYQHVEGTRKDHILTESLKWEIGIEGGGHIEEIPKGFIFQVSSPRAYDWLQSKLKFLPNLAHHRSLLLPSAVHDWFLSQNYPVTFASSEFARAVRLLGGGVTLQYSSFILTLLWTYLGRILRRNNA